MLVQSRALFHRARSPAPGHMNRMKYRLFAVLGFFVAVGTLAVVYRNLLTIDRLIAEEENVRNLLADHPVVGFLVGFAVYGAVCFVPGTTGKSLIVGWLFGFWQALVQVNVALTIVAMLTFWLSRYVLRDAVRSRAGARLTRIDEAIQREGAYYLFALRVLHGPYSVINYVMGSTSLRSSSFWWATQLGMLPGNIVFVYTGSQLPSIKQLAEEGLVSMITPGIIVAFVAVSVVPLLMRSVVRRILPGVAARQMKR